MGDGWLIAPSITEASVARLGIPAATTSAAEPWYASSFPAATAPLKQPCSPARRATGIGSPNAVSAWQTCGLRMRCTDYRREVHHSKHNWSGGQLLAGLVRELGWRRKF